MQVIRGARLSAYSGKRSHLVTVLDGILGVIYRDTVCFWPSHPFFLLPPCCMYPLYPYQIKPHSLL